MSAPPASAPAPALQPLDAPATLLAPYAARILDDLDRVLFAEAARAASCGALRLAYAATWMSCAESLKRKFRELAPRDAIAQRVVKEIDRKESLYRAVDRALLEEARTYGFLTHLEYAKLAHIHEMSCVYVRPQEEEPRVETLLAAASDVVEIVLSRPTRLRHGYLKEQVRRLTTDRAFLDDLEEPVARYAADVHARAADDLHLWFLQQVGRAVELVAASAGPPALIRRGVWFMSAYLRALGADGMHGWDVVADLGRSPTVLPAALADPPLFAVLTPHAQDIVVGHLLADEARRVENLRRLDALHAAGALNARQVERFTYAIGSLPLSDLQALGVRPVHLAPTLVQELRSRDWYRQNEAVRLLRGMGSDGIGALPDALQLALGSALLQAADETAHDAVAFLQDIADSDERWPAPFVEGMVAECLLDDRGGVRFQATHAQEAFLALRTVQPASRGPIVQRLAARIREGTWVAKVYFRKEVAEILAVIERVLQRDETGLRDLRSLGQALLALRSHQTT